MKFKQAAKRFKRCFGRKHRGARAVKRDANSEPTTPIEVANDFCREVRARKRLERQKVTVKGIFAEAYYNEVGTPC